MSKELVIDFAADGHVQAMHMDNFDLGFLGSKSVTRATEIKFDESSQSWGLFLPATSGDGWVKVQHGDGFASYEEARSYEVAWLNICRAFAYCPHSQDAVAVLWSLRLGSQGFSRPLTLEEFESAYRRPV